ncbi:MAG TPA: M48 family metallopeptidase [Opitutaceae bacterium]|jgi:STE24 endopeptidase|nr:M48 family metallopeptidase [Opitutaceae bacterium]
MVIIFTAILIVMRLAAELWLNALNRREVLRHANAAPPAVAAIMDAPTYTKAVAYTLAKGRLAQLQLIFDAGLLALVVFSGALPWLFARVCGPSAGSGQAWSGALFILITGVLLGLPGLPFEWWEQFRLEEKFGFNKSTPRLWIADKLKGLALAGVIGFPLLWGLFALVRAAGGAWWLWGWALLFCFQLLMVVLYPQLIMPLFNKLTPLPEDELRARLMALAERTGFRARTIQVIDGSKRSAHSNAFFTGFGRFRRIVLFDTLIEQLTTEELEAVLAHEIGHYRLGHIPRMLAVSAALQLGGFATLAWLARSPWFATAFGFPPGALAPVFLLFGLLGGLVTFWFSPIGNLFSRRHEYQADAFAREALGAPAPMAGALRKLAQKNLSNLTPHPLFSGFYYSHPTLVEREQALIKG